MSFSDRLTRIFWWLPFGQVPEISPAELYASLQSDTPPQLLDVRSAAEWRLSRIPGAPNVSVKQLRRHIESLELDKERPVVAICLSAHRSIPAVRLLRAKGFTNAMQLESGMLAWWKQDLPTEASD